MQKNAFPAFFYLQLMIDSSGVSVLVIHWQLSSRIRRFDDI